MLGKGGAERLKTWVEDGGTLVTMGAGSAFAADSTVALTSIREKSQIFKRLPEYDRALAYAKAAVSPVVDSVDVWDVKPVAEKKDEKKLAPPDVDSLKDADETARKLRPRGAILAVDLKEKHWLTFGARSPLAVLVDTDCVYLAKSPVEVAGKFAPRDRLRLSGLLWPEARERWSETAFVAREARRNGQIILFADTPNFRGYFYGGERLLLNAILLGPGFGTNQAFY
jgi:hypothetical protein